MNFVAIGRRIKALRAHKGWKQSELAAAAGVATNTVSTLERATRQTQRVPLAKIAAALGTTLEAIVQDPAVTHGSPAGLSQEEIRIARGFHDATTRVRIAVERLIRHGEADPMLRWWARWIALDDPQRALLDREFTQYELQRATRHTTKPPSIR